MVDILIFILGLALCVQAVIGLTYFISSIWEKEVRASVLGGIQFLVMLGLVVLFLYLNSIQFFDTAIGAIILVLAFIVGVVASILLFTRIGANPRALEGTKALITADAKRFDGRAIPLPGIEKMTKPPGPPSQGPATEVTSTENQGPPPQGMQPPPAPTQGIPPDFNPAARMEMIFGDTMFRIDRPHEKPNLAAGISTFVYLAPMGFTQFCKPKPKDKALSMSPEEATERIKGFARAVGADLVGITELNPLWVYSNYGMTFNTQDIGKEIPVDHKYAIVFGEEMEFDMVATAPHTPTGVETGIKYAKGTYISTNVANLIAQMGHSATANSQAFYEAQMVPLAVDAGLGECARSGSLVTKELGMRLRLSAVTTDIPLIPDKPVDIGVEDFCNVCKKCAHNCPSNSIKHGDMAESEGLIRWKHNGKTCGERWLVTGTDCAICMRVCPWSHARTLPHKFIVWAVSRNKFARRLFVLMDDIFYGKKPKAKAPPNWASFEKWKEREL